MMRRLQQQQRRTTFRAGLFVLLISSAKAFLYFHSASKTWKRVPVSSLLALTDNDNGNNENDNNSETTNNNNNNNISPTARIVNAPPHLELDLLHSLQSKGFSTHSNRDENEKDDSCNAVAHDVTYKWNAAVGMLQRMQVEANNNNNNQQYENFPQWIPLVQEQEQVLVSNGWSFLDVDESEPLSSFDVDAAHSEHTYRPQWKQEQQQQQQEQLDHPTARIKLSSLGFSLSPWSKDKILSMADERLQSDLTRQVLLQGATDPPGKKQTHNRVDWTGSIDLSRIPRGIFTCALTNLPLFASTDLLPTTASSGWLSLARPLAADHILLIPPEPGALDRRTEVVCAVSRCHLGHYFGAEQGYCINASVLNFVAEHEDTDAIHKSHSYLEGPISYETFERVQDDSPAVAILKTVVSRLKTETIILGAGCFWGVEAALRRLPGVVSTSVGYAGGHVQHPTYPQVCKDETGHAEVVRVEFDPNVLDPTFLLECFLSLHDPTKVRAHGKHAEGTGQYRSCIFLPSTKLEAVARETLEVCGRQLGREIITKVQIMNDEMDEWFWPAEEYHQRHKEKSDEGTETSTLDLVEWLDFYGRRRASVLGSATSMDDNSAHNQEAGYSRNDSLEEATAQMRFMI